MAWGVGWGTLSKFLAARGQEMGQGEKGAGAEWGGYPVLVLVWGAGQGCDRGYRGPCRGTPQLSRSLWTDKQSENITCSRTRVVIITSNTLNLLSLIFKCRLKIH